MKRLSADDSAGSRVKVGHRQATLQPEDPSPCTCVQGLCLPKGVGAVCKALRSVQAKLAGLKWCTLPLL